MAPRRPGSQQPTEPRMIRSLCWTLDMGHWYWCQAGSGGRSCGRRRDVRAQLQLNNSEVAATLVDFGSRGGRGGGGQGGSGGRGWGGGNRQQARGHFGRFDEEEEMPQPQGIHRYGPPHGAGMMAGCGYAGQPPAGQAWPNRGPSSQISDDAGRLWFSMWHMRMQVRGPPAEALPGTAPPPLGRLTSSGS
eukprot:scaffold23360_cov137-Isochrysis_galbana.AAC.3